MGKEELNSTAFLPDLALPRGCGEIPSLSNGAQSHRTITVYVRIFCQPTDFVF